MARTKMVYIYIYIYIAQNIKQNFMNTIAVPALVGLH